MCMCPLTNEFVVIPEANGIHLCVKYCMKFTLNHSFEALVSTDVVSRAWGEEMHQSGRIFNILSSFFFSHRFRTLCGDEVGRVYSAEFNDLFVVCGSSETTVRVWDFNPHSRLCKQQSKKLQ